MSQKWIRSKRWDDEHLTGALVPVKVVLRVLSGIPLAVVLLTLVALYGVLASVPIGLLALVPTYAIYALSLVIAVGVVAVAPTVAGGRVLRQQGVPLGARYAAAFAALVTLGIVAVWGWHALVWPRLGYDAVSGTGLRLFASFVDRYQSVQFRRLPIMEMSELEFYGWWPLKLLLVLFVVNMVVATVRRIEFTFPNLGVLTVHTGIVLIALGSVYYSAMKQEGDVLLQYGGLDERGHPLPGRPEAAFYDNTAVALWVRQGGRAGWEQRGLRGVPRYNDYNLDALGAGFEAPPGTRGLGPLDVPVPSGLASMGAAQTGVDADVRFRVIGYASYATLEERWVAADRLAAAPEAGAAVREVAVVLDAPADAQGGAAQRARQAWRFVPDVPAERVRSLGGAGGADLLAVEYTRGMAQRRWDDLASSLPTGTTHALVVRHPESGFRGVYPVEPETEIAVGETGYTLTVAQLASRPPFPIITRGYEGAASSVAVVRVRPPDGAEPYERWVYHRFPEISQDLLGGGDGGMPRRRAADPAIEIDYVDASMVQVYLDEIAPEQGQDGGARVRALVRLPGGTASVTPDVGAAGGLRVLPALRLELGERMDGVVRVETPRVVPEIERDRQAFGTHQNAAVAVEVTTDAAPGWRRVVWVPFSQYLGVEPGLERPVRLPDGRDLTLVFGRVRHEFWPPMAVQLVDFKMTPYPHSTMPQDYRSDLRVIRRGEEGGWLERKTSLNEPLLVRMDFVPNRGAPPVVREVVNAIGWAFDRIAPNQYKFAQAGWDQAGWREAEAAVAAGELPRPFARFTILGVGNNPGIYIIATGAVLMSLGIPWAFYVKPLIVRRRKRKIQAALARGERPAAPRSNGAVREVAAEVR